MKKKTNISDNTLKLISKNQIKPIPKWELAARQTGLWMGFGLCLISLVLGISVSLFGLMDNIITPYFWILITVFFLVLSFFVFEKTKKAYRYFKWQVIASIGIVGVLVGGILFKAGLASKIDRNFESTIPRYRQIVPMKMVVWSNPEQGYLSGEIINIASNNNFRIKDFKNNVWNIASNNPLIRGRVQMVVGEEVKLIGTQTSVNTFQADEIRPWNGMRQNIMKEY